jgi:hypothetical protein
VGTAVTRENIRDAIASFASQDSFMDGGVTVEVPSETSSPVDVSMIPSSVYSSTGLWLNEAWTHCYYYGDQERTKGSTFFVSSYVCFQAFAKSY